MATLPFTVFVIALLKQSASRSANNVYCPESKHDNQAFEGAHDYGLNIYANLALTKSSQHYSADCYLRYDNDSKATLTKTAIISDFFNPQNNLLIMIHGWQTGADNRHFTPDRWSNYPTLAQCYNDANPKNNEGKQIEPCPPTDHDAQYWYNNGFNVIFFDWIQYANEGIVWDAEIKLYDCPNCDGGKNVTQLLYQLLKRFLDIVEWRGNELRIAGNSLGAQFAMLLGYKIKTESKYKNKLARIALLDAYYSPALHFISNECQIYWLGGTCSVHKRYWVGKYAREIVLPEIRKGEYGAVIVHYRTSLVVSNKVIANTGLTHRTIMVDLKPKYYHWNIPAQHVAPLAFYLHCMKWEKDPQHETLQPDVPTCRMSTETLKGLCKIDPNENDYKKMICRKRWYQLDDDNTKTTWDFDNKYQECDMKGGNCHNVEGKTTAVPIAGYKEYLNEFDIADEDIFYYDEDDGDNEYDDEMDYESVPYLYGYQYYHHKYYELLMDISVLLIGLAVFGFICCSCFVIGGVIVFQYKKKMESKELYITV